MLKYITNYQTFKGNNFPTITEEELITRLNNKYPTFEVTGLDDSITKMYFDIDYKLQNQPYDEDINQYLKSTGETYINKCINELFNIEPNIAIATSSCDNKYSWRYFVSNIKMKKNEMKQFIIKLNKFIEQNDCIYKDELIENRGGLFDIGIYDNNRKMRCINTSKPNENRPLILTQGTIKDTIITGFLNEANLITFTSDEDSYIPKSPNSITMTIEETYLDDIDYLLNVCIKDNMCSEGQHKEWVTIGQALKNELNEQAVVPFVNWTNKFGTENKKNEAFIKITKEIKAQKETKKIKPVKLATIHFYAKKYNPEKYYCRFKKQQEFQYNNDIESCLTNSNDYSIATYFYNKYGNIFKCVDIQNKVCYSFTKNNLWEEFKSGTLIREFISNELTTDFINYQGQVNMYIKTLTPEQDIDKDKYLFKEKKLDEQIIKFGKTNDKNNITREIYDKILDINFCKDINKQKYVLPIKNKKLFNMKTLKCEDRTINDKFSFECNANYVELTEQEEKDIRQYFNDLFCNNETTTQCVLDIIKSILTGETLRYIYFWTGSGSNGKSILLKLLNVIFGKFMDTIDTNVILDKKVSSQLTTQFEKLDKCRVGYITELKEEDKLNEPIIKKISGGDAIDFRGLYSSNKTINPTCNLMVVTNVLPTFKVEKAILNRIVVIPFNNTFKTNISFEAEMMEKLDIIFSFIMKYGVIRDEFELNEEMALAKKNYVENNNEPLDEFIKEMVNITDNENDKIPNTDFFVSYQNWLQQNNIKISTTKQKVTRDIKKYNIESKESNGKTWYKKCAWKVSDTELDVL